MRDVVGQASHPRHLPRPPGDGRGLRRRSSSARRRPMHGDCSEINHDGKGLFEGLPQRFSAGRYHSLIVDLEGRDTPLDGDGRSDEGEIMGLRHKSHPTYGVQFHPESILTEGGYDMLRNFLKVAGMSRSWFNGALRGRHCRLRRERARAAAGRRAVRDDPRSQPHAAVGQHAPRRLEAAAQELGLGFDRDALDDALGDDTRRMRRDPPGAARHPHPRQRGCAGSPPMAASPACSSRSIAFDPALMFKPVTLSSTAIRRNPQSWPRASRRSPTSTTSPPPARPQRTARRMR